MIEEERLNRFKHGRPNEVAGLWGRFAGKYGYFPWASVTYCLEAADLSLENVDLVAVGDDLWAAPAKDTIAAIIPIKDKDKVVYIDRPEGAAHHFHHALSAYFGSPFDEAAVLIVDADGNSSATGYEAESGFYFQGRQGQHLEVFKNRYTSPGFPRAGLGWTYEQVTILLGFANPKIFLADAGKTMGLSSWGKPQPEFQPWIRYNGFSLDFSGFHKWLCDRGFDRRLSVRHEGLATFTEEVMDYAKDVAYKVQVEIEQAVLHLATELYRKTGSKNLCLAGGVALNSVANGVIATKGPFERVFIQPAANDAGQALGLAFHGHLLLTGETPMSGGVAAAKAVSRYRTRVSESRPEIRPMSDAYLGRSYTASEIQCLVRMSGLKHVEFSDDEALVRDAAKELAARNIVGWFQGGSECGPRALGHRSILANPDRQEMVDVLNRRVKFREAFRPFAPSVLAEKAAEVFELSGESPYMLLVVPVREHWRNRVPAITHIDGTARVQTVTPQSDPLYYGLIKAFEEITGVPLIINTSFNLRGMPIVESPLDALQCFLFTDMDCLYLGRTKVHRPDASALFPSFSMNWEILESTAGNGEKNILFKRCSSEIRLHGMPELLAILSRTDAGKSLRAAYEEVEQAADSGALAPLSEIVCRVQELVRRGALCLHVGKLTFAELDTGLHWWQKSW